MDSTPTLPVIQHAVRFLEEESNFSPGWIMILQPTTPLRTSSDIMSAIRLSTDDEEVETVLSVYGADQFHPQKMMKQCDGWLRPFLHGKKKTSLRQEYKPQAFLTNGGIYLSKRSVIMEQNQILGSNVRPYLMPHERSIDIDTEFDFLLAEFLMRRQHSGLLPG